MKIKSFFCLPCVIEFFENKILFCAKKNIFSLKFYGKLIQKQKETNWSLKRIPNWRVVFITFLYIFYCWRAIFLFFNLLLDFLSNAMNFILITASHSLCIWLNEIVCTFYTWRAFNILCRRLFFAQSKRCKKSLRIRWCVILIHDDD